MSGTVDITEGIAVIDQGTERVSVTQTILIIFTESASLDSTIVSAMSLYAVFILANCFSKVMPFGFYGTIHTEYTWFSIDILRQTLYVLLR